MQTIKRSIKWSCAGFVALLGLCGGLQAPAAQFPVYFPVATNTDNLRIGGGIASFATNNLAMAVFLKGTNVQIKVIQVSYNMGLTTSNGVPVGGTGTNLVKYGLPEITTLGTNYLVAWTDSSITNGPNTFGRLVSQGGAVQGPAFTLLAPALTNTAGLAQLMGLAGSSANALAVLKDGNGNVWSQLIAPDGSLPMAPAILASNVTTVTHATAAFGTTNYLVAWRSTIGSGSNVTFGALVSTAGVVSLPFQISQLVSSVAHAVAAAFDGTNYLTAWVWDYPGGIAEIHGCLVAPNGMLSGTETTMVANAAHDSDTPSLAFNSNTSKYLLMWMDRSSSPSFKFHHFDTTLNACGLVVSPNTGALLAANALCFDGRRIIALPTFGSATTNADGSFSNITSATVWGVLLYRPTTLLYLEDAAGNVVRWAQNLIGAIQHYDTMGGLGGWVLKARSDFNTNNVPDLFWQHPTGWVVAWFSQPDGSYQAVSLGNLGAWEIRAAADVDGDGVADLILQHPSGWVVIWLMNANGTLKEAVSLGNLGGWRLKAAHDMLGKGYADLFWQTADGWVAAWMSNAGGILDSYYGVGFGNWGIWELRAIADMDGDGVPDFVWEHPSGATVVSYLNSNITIRASAGLGNIGRSKIMAVD